MCWSQVRKLHLTHLITRTWMYVCLQEMLQMISVQNKAFFFKLKISASRNSDFNLLFTTAHKLSWFLTHGYFLLFKVTTNQLLKLFFSKTTSSEVASFLIYNTKVSRFSYVSTSLWRGRLKSNKDSHLLHSYLAISRSKTVKTSIFCEWAFPYLHSPTGCCGTAPQLSWLIPG